jgi:hypothetical protein
VRKADHGVDDGQPDRAGHEILRSLALVRMTADAHLTGEPAGAQDDIGSF